MNASARRFALMGAPLVAALALSACGGKSGELVVDDAVGVTALRDPCPRVGIPDSIRSPVLMSWPAAPIPAAHAGSNCPISLL
ncbi:hypothetical protein [Novosphingobium sp. 17-62-19]|uniref:hypothetical protein n=1 Tax=Novosphingobium sp. 17-62-19 TaxID=1970406 RepID=UPI00344E58DD